jgi:hypothetical protein
MYKKDETMIQVINEVRIGHFRNCYSYKKTILRVIDTFNLSFELDKYIFSYVGFSAFYLPDYKVDELVALRLKE